MALKFSPKHLHSQVGEDWKRDQQSDLGEIHLLASFSSCWDYKRQSSLMGKVAVGQYCAQL